MPRKKRIHSENSIYHVMSRGNRKKNIFIDNADKRLFCRYMKTNLEQFDHDILAFCIMHNHFHIAIKVNKTPLETIMHQLLSRYSKYFNAKYELVRHCFQGRYVSKCVHDESYLFDLCKYIHLNPVRAQLVNTADEYYWSSHTNYLGRERFSWINTEVLLARINNDMAQAREKYLKFISKETEYPKQILLSFHDTKKNSGQSPISSTCSLKQLIQFVAIEYKQTPQRLTEPSHCPRRCEARAVVGYLAVKYKIASLAAVATAFHRSQPTISQAVYRLRRQLKSRAQLLNKILKLEKTIN